jgi:hypothetical protein
MADVKVPALLHKMSVSSQKAWYKKHGMEMPDDTGGRSAAAAKKIKLQPRKVVEIEPDSVRAINAARQKKYMEKGGRQPIGAAGSGGSSVMAGSNMSTAKGIVTGIKAGFNPRLSLDPYESERAKKVGPRSLNRKDTGRLKEDKDEHEYDYEGEMAMSQLKSIIANSQRLYDMLKPKTDLPEWVQSKITLAEDYIVTATNYCASDLEESVNEEVEQIDEKYMGFNAVQKAVAAKGARNPAAVAAYIGRKKYGKEKFQAMAAAGKKANEEVVVEGSEGKTPETETEVNLAKKYGDPNKITYGDVIKARIQSAKNKALKKGD